MSFVPTFDGGVAQTVRVNAGAFDIELEPGIYRANVADKAPQYVEVPPTVGPGIEINLNR